MTASQEISAAFPFKSQFVEVKGSQIHYVEEGSDDPILFIHGQPTSSYLWRNIIPHLSSQGRCIALDLIGFGKSDKPDIEYRFPDHVEYVEGFIEKLGLKNITFVIHDWGSALGFHYASRNEGNVKGLAFMEALLTTYPTWDDFPAGFRPVFEGFRNPDVNWDMLVTQHMFMEQILPGAIVRKLSDAEMNTYREPFTDPASRKPIWRWPNEIALAGEPADNVATIDAYNQWLQTTQLPKILLHAEPSGIIAEPQVEWSKQNLKNLKTVHVGPGIHYIQEDNPHGIGEAISEWFKGI